MTGPFSQQICLPSQWNGNTDVTCSATLLRRANTGGEVINSRQHVLCSSSGSTLLKLIQVWRSPFWCCWSIFGLLRVQNVLRCCCRRNKHLYHTAYYRLPLKVSLEILLRVSLYTVSYKKVARCFWIYIVQSIYGKKPLNPQKIATKGFSLDSVRFSCTL